MNIAIEKGYIESVMGFKLKLPRYYEFLEYKDSIKGIDWKSYAIGKKEYKAKQEAKELKEVYIIEDQKSYNIYYDNKDNVSNYFKLRSQYFRLSLNNPSQGRSAFQSKLAGIYLWNTIVKNNDFENVKIVNFIYDEWVLEVKKEFAEKYKIILENCMRVAANKIMDHSEIKFTVEAVIGPSWGEAKN